MRAHSLNQLDKIRDGWTGRGEGGGGGVIKGALRTRKCNSIAQATGACAVTLCIRHSTWGLISMSSLPHPLDPHTLSPSLPYVMHASRK